MMYQEALVALIDDAYGDLFRNAEPLSDKLDFKATENNRSPREILAECATGPAFLAQVLRTRAMPENVPDEPHDQAVQSVEDARVKFESLKGDLYDAIRTFPTEALMETIETPWGTFAWRDFMAYAYWNPMYHVGQLAYIQMMHGDTNMY